MNAPIDTLAFADRFESAGFDPEQARALASAFGNAQDSTREGLVTKDHLDARLAEMETRLTKQISDSAKELSGRLWSTIAIVAGVSTAISATIGAGVALILKIRGL